MTRIRFRPNSLDKAIYNCVVVANEYRLPVRFAPDAVVVDIGAHVGFFTLAALQRGASRVLAFEPSPENALHARSTLEDYIATGTVDLRELAVWRSDACHDELVVEAYPDYHGISNTGGCRVLPQGSGTAIPHTALDAVIDEIVERHAHPIDLLKIDAEGSEWPILFTSKRLHHVQAICGEFHEYGSRFNPSQAPFALPGHGPCYTQETLTQFLQSAGFEVQSRRNYDAADGGLSCRGLFFATRTN